MHIQKKQTMLRDIKEVIKNDLKLKYILLAGLVIQILFSITATGFYHPDQHFQVVEFSSYQSGEPNAASVLWEYDNPVRATVQVYLFTAWHWFITTIGIHNTYLELALLRILLGLLMFVVFNIIALHYFKNEKKIILYSVLLLLNFSWFLPYIKTLFSSEMLSSLFFFGTACWYDMKKDKNPRMGFLILIGFLLGLSFYFRFQTGFFIAGYGIWMLMKQKNIHHYLFIAAGFIACALINTWLDYEFYKRLVFTPYEYFYANIIDKRAASFGTSSFLRYVGLLIALVPVPPLSLFLFYYALKTFIKKYDHLVFLTVLLFIIGHSLVGHKEERFMFPVLCVMPLMIGWGLPGLIRFYSNCKKWLRYILNTVILFSVSLNLLLLILLLLNPYSQTVHFTVSLKKYIKKHDNPSRIYSFNRTPFETESITPVIFYRKDFKNLEFIKIADDEIPQIKDSMVFFTATFERVIDKKELMDSLGYKPVLYSSRLIWKLNEYLFSKKIHTINDIWVLYEKQK